MCCSLHESVNRVVPQSLFHAGTLTEVCCSGEGDQTPVFQLSTLKCLLGHPSMPCQLLVLVVCDRFLFCSLFGLVWTVGWTLTRQPHEAKKAKAGLA